MNSFKHAIKLISNSQIGFLGIGNMAQVMIGKLNTNNAKELVKGFSPSQRQVKGVKTYANMQDLFNEKDLKILFYCMKPQSFNDKLKTEINKRLDKFTQRPITASCLAGLSREETDCDIVYMPNILAEEGHNVIFADCSNQFPEHKKSIFVNLFKNMGKIIWVKDPSDMHMAVASSGSAPAYVIIAMEKAAQILIASDIEEKQAKLAIINTFLTVAKNFLNLVRSSPQEISFAELYKSESLTIGEKLIIRGIGAYCYAMQQLGLDAKTSYLVAAETVYGTVKLMHKRMQENGNVDFYYERKKIMSPGGTTEAAMNVAEKASINIFTSQNNLNDFLTEVLKAAYNRSIELKEAKKVNYQSPTRK